MTSWLFGEVEIIFHGANLEQDENQKMMLVQILLRVFTSLVLHVLNLEGGMSLHNLSAHLPTSPLSHPSS